MNKRMIRGISKDAWKGKFDTFGIQEEYYSPDKSLLFITVNESEKFISTFNGISWKGDSCVAESSIFTKFIFCKQEEKEEIQQISKE